MWQKLTGGTWDGRGHSQDLLSPPEDGTLQTGLCHTELWGKRRLLAQRRQGADVPRGTLRTPGHCWQDMATPRKAPLPDTRNSPVPFLHKEHLEDVGRWSQAAAHPASLWDRQSSTGTCPCGEVTQQSTSQTFILPDLPDRGLRTGTIPAGVVPHWLCCLIPFPGHWHSWCRAFPRIFGGERRLARTGQQRARAGGSPAAAPNPSPAKHGMSSHTAPLRPGCAHPCPALLQVFCIPNTPKPGSPTAGAALAPGVL